MTSAETARRRPGPPRASVVAGIGLAAAWSLLRKGYQFDGYYADDQFWNALVIDRLHPGLLAADPVVALIGDRYQSALFEALALAAPVVGLPLASFALFCLARVLACTAIYRLAVTLTRSPGSGVLAAFLLAGASVSYLGGIHLVETILTPRGFALPLGLFAVDSFLRGRPAAMAAWLVACLAVHPVSGANFLGALVFCGVCFGDGGSRRAFALSLAALVPAVVGVALWTGAGSGPLRLDPQWAAVVADTVGPWVYLARTPGAVWLSSLWLPLLGAFAVARIASPPLRAAFLHFAAATAAALALHALLVDGAQLRPLLQAAPQRASVVLTSIALVAVAGWVWRNLWAPDPLGRVLAIALLLAALLLADPTPALLLGCALFAAGFLPTAPSPRRRARAALATAALFAVLALGGRAVTASFRMTPEALAWRLARLRSLGVNEPWATVQRHIRDHSAPGDVVMAPPAESPRVFARRPSALRVKMQSFTHVSRDFAFRYAAWRDAVGRHLETANTVRALELARQSGASWLVVDDRRTPEAAEDPVPDFRAGPYRAFSLAIRPAAEPPG